MVWSRHFVITLLKLPGDDRPQQELRLKLLHAGVTVVVIGVLGRWLPVTIIGATLVVGAVLWHAWALIVGMKRALPARFNYTARYYLAAAALLPVGVVLGVFLASGFGPEVQGRLILAHTVTNLLGWVGISILGTASTLWPTMLRTRLVVGTEKWAKRALPVLLLGIAIVWAGAAFDLRRLAAVGVLVYAVGLATMAVFWYLTVKNKRPDHFATWSMGAGFVWFQVGIVWLGIDIWISPTWERLHEAYDILTPVLAVGFVTQVLLGALAYLIPSVVGGGPTVVRAGSAAVDRWGIFRVLVLNLGLALWLATDISAIRVTLSVVVLLPLIAAIVFMLLGVRASLKAMEAMREGGQPVPPDTGDKPIGLQVVAGLAALMLAVGAGIMWDPAAVGISTVSNSKVTPTGKTKTVAVTMENMRFVPDEIKVDRGDRLVIKLTHKEPGQIHDLVLANGKTSGRMRAGETKSVDVGVIGESMDGWCSVAGHRQMGMTMKIIAEGGSDSTAETDKTTHDMDDMDDMDHDSGSHSMVDMNAEPAKDWKAPNAVLPELPPGPPVVRRVEMRVTEQKIEVAPGVKQERWLFGGSAPGPVLHGRVGDTFVVTLINDGTMGHSIDFHASEIAPNKVMRTIAPGESLVYRFKAKRAGIWMYHCSTMPMSLHIAKGLYGAVIIEPRDLPRVDHSYVLVQGEHDLSDEPMMSFNGYAFAYRYRPLEARVGETVRFWVLDAGPDRPLSFHVVGEQFDTVWSEGRYLIKKQPGVGSQALGLLPAQGGFVELSAQQPGDYPFVNHVMSDAERGASGVLSVK
jgi:nitrite reductase (NO-forming)